MYWNILKEDFMRKHIQIQNCFLNGLYRRQILLNVVTILYNFLKSILQTNVLEYSYRRLYDEAYSDSKLFFEWSLETTEIIECLSS